jgi:hypothetical protein
MCGKEVLCGDKHIADCINDHEASRIVAGLNTMMCMVNCWPSCQCIRECEMLVRRRTVEPVSDEGGQNG